MDYLRLRQICLVASDLATVERQIADVLGLEICFRDPGVGKYGLHNALFAMSGTFLEVVSPTREGTAAGRYIERRKGDGGYMYIVDCDDLERRRDHILAKGVRLVEDLKSTEHGLTGEALHLHPRDTGGCLLSVDRHSPDGESMAGSYKWAGADWISHDRSHTVRAIAGARMQCDDPSITAARWSELLERPVVRAGGAWTIELDNAFARFTGLEDDRGEGLSAVRLACRDVGAILANAERAKVKIGEGSTGPFVELCGTEFVLV
jgi:hypothetical protein